MGKSWNGTAWVKKTKNQGNRQKLLEQALSVPFKLGFLTLSALAVKVELHH
jgi:hypothetical protein